MQTLDPQKTQAFAQRMLQTLNHGALCLMISIGHRTGRFDTLAELPPSPSDAIARRAGLHERYVREWLGALWGRETALDLLAQAGFSPVEVHQLDHDFQNDYYIAQKTSPRGSGKKVEPKLETWAQENPIRSRPQPGGGEGI